MRLWHVLPFSFTAAFLALAGCSSPALTKLADGGTSASSCTACAANADCGSESCVQLENDSVCAHTCQSDSDCGSVETCVALTNTSGAQTHACIATSCGPLPTGMTTEDGGSSSQLCNGLAGPNVSGTNCTCGRAGQCAANNCYGGWYCDTSKGQCVAPPPSCASSGGTDGGSSGTVTVPTGPVMGSVDAHNGGSVNRLFFAVVGDTRPPNQDDISNYPTQIANGIYGALAKLNPGPEFIVTTGDYMYASTSGSSASQQMQLYLQAANQVSVPHWPVMGNHECTGYTASNCPNYNETSNIKTFMSSMMQPIGESKPYYMRTVNAMDGSWSAKFLFVAPNAWDSTQSQWLDTQLGMQTTYTFVIKHESADTTQLSSISQIASIVARHPLTLGIVGHTHSWEWKTGEVIIGNGGAPMTSTVPYGYTLFSQRSDGAIVIQAIDYTTGQPFRTYAVTPSGARTN